ncbi:sigma-54 interaction domain-containing protein [Thermomonas sp.]|uniref:sigma-54 interaction domain-containing protein n=1 Tax=Thermomonas sp. TaxID=1971895 RepID=UPI00391C3A5B
MERDKGTIASVNGEKCCVIWFGHPDARERMALAAEGWQVRAIAGHGPEQIRFRGTDREVLLFDLRHASPLEIRWMAGHASRHPASDAVALGRPGPDAPAEAARLLFTCSQHIEHNDLNPLLAYLRARSAGAHACHASLSNDLMGESKAMLYMRKLLHKYAVIELPVLICGETGTGKELAANALHRLSPRASRPILAVNCGAISSSLLQSELFGHEKGAFTGAVSRRQGLFESADSGTVFLDEVGDLPAEAQTSLLRVLQEGTVERLGSNHPIQVNVRIIAATHVDLEEAVRTGRFRRDLYYRLNVLHLPMPALRDRGQDVLLLAAHFLASFRTRYGTRAVGFTEMAKRALLHHPWPGNVRELLNRIQRAAVTAESELIDCEDLGLAAIEVAANSPVGDGLDERDYLLDCLARTDYNVSACARLMRVSRVTIYRMCNRHGIALERLRAAIA